MMARIGRGGVIVAVLFAAAANLSGQPAPARQAEPNGEVLSALLVEVRGLRAAMEQMASAGPRVQLFASRLQLQEARINNMIRRLETVRDSLADAQQEYANALNHKKQLDAALDEHRRNPTPAGAEELKQADFMLAEANAQAALRKATLDRYTAEELQLMSDLTTEQARWSDINQRLDELERALGKR